MKTLKRNLFLIGLLLFLTELWKQYILTVQLNNGSYNWWYFPFQLCSIPMYICLLLPFFHSRNMTDIMLSFLQDFGLMGGILAFLDTSGMQYPLKLLTLHSYVWHVILVLIGLYVGLFQHKRNSKISFMGCGIIYLLCVSIACILNRMLGVYGTINMFYINPKYWMAQIVFKDIAKVWSNHGAIILYICCSILGAYIIHQIWNIGISKENKND